jgi:hypothetical protein
VSARMSGLDNQLNKANRWGKLIVQMLVARGPSASALCTRLPSNFRLGRSALPAPTAPCPVSVALLSMRSIYPVLDRKPERRLLYIFSNRVYIQNFSLAIKRRLTNLLSLLSDRGRGWAIGPMWMWPGRDPFSQHVHVHVLVHTFSLPFSLSRLPSLRLRLRLHAWTRLSDAFQRSITIMCCTSYECARCGGCAGDTVKL